MSGIMALIDPGDDMAARKGGGVRQCARQWAKRLSHVALLLVSVSVASAAVPAIPIITTYAGTGYDRPSDPYGNGGPATSAKLSRPSDVALDEQGNLYVVAANSVRWVTPAGIISTYAGTGSSVYTGDGSQASQSGMLIGGIALDKAGNLYISDMGAHRIYKVVPDGTISVIAGLAYNPGFSGDGGDAKLAQLYKPTHLAVDGAGNLLVTDFQNSRLRKITPQGIISTIAGNGTYDLVDGAVALDSGLGNPGAAVADHEGNIYVISFGRVMKIDTAGRIRLHLGGGDFTHDPVASHVRLSRASGLALDKAGNLYVVELEHLVRMYSPDGYVRKVAGIYGSTSGDWGSSGDGGPAEEAGLNQPVDIAIDAQGNQYISDQLNHRVRKITPQPPITAPKALSMLEEPYTIPLPGPSAGVVAADINGDGRRDIISTTSASPLYEADAGNEFKLRIQLQKPDHSFGTAIEFDYPRGLPNRGGWLAPADLNSDGIDDIVLGHSEGTSWIRGTGSSTFALLPFESGGSLNADQAMTVADLNRDGKHDVITAHNAGGGREVLTIAYGDGAGGSTGRHMVDLAPLRTSERRTLAVGDVTGDGWPDIMDAGYSVHVLNNDGRGGVLPPSLLLNDRMAGVAIGDLDQDGRADAIVSRAYTVGMMVFLQRASTLIPPSKNHLAYSDGFESLILDINNDGHTDVVTSYGKAVGLSAGASSGLEGEVKFPLPAPNLGRPPPLAVADIDRDGCLDVLAPAWKVGLVIYRGKNCRVRVNGDQPRVPTVTGRIPILSTPQSADGSASLLVSEATVRTSSVTGRLRGWLIRFNVLARLRDMFEAIRETRLQVRVARSLGGDEIAHARIADSVSVQGGPQRSLGADPSRRRILLSRQDRYCLR